MTDIVRNVFDGRGPMPSTADWQVEPLVVEELKPEDLNRNVVYVDPDVSPPAPRMGTLCAFSKSSRSAWAKFTSGDFGDMCVVSGLSFAIAVAT